MPIPPDLQIYYPNGGTSAAQMYIWDGSKPIVWDGSINVTTTGGPIQDGVDPLILATVLDLVASNPQAVAIVDANGDQISSFGGGVQYTEGDVATTATGTAIMWRTGGNIMIPVDAANPLPVDVSGLPAGLALASLQQIDALTDTELRATPIDVLGPLTDTELRATPVPISIADAEDVTQGAKADARSTATDTTPITIVSILKQISFSIQALVTNLGTLVFGAGTAAAAQRTTLASDDPAVSVLGATTGAKVITDANGTLQQYLRGLIYLLITSGQAQVNANNTTGNIAHDGADSGNPLKIGAKALSYGTNPTGVANNDRTDLYSNIAGILHILGGHPNIISLETEYTGAQTNAAIVTVSGGAKIVVTHIQALLDEATTVGVGLRVGFATATTPTTTGVILSHPGLVPGSGINAGDGSGILGVGADGEDLRITSEVPTTGALRIKLSYFTIES